MMKKVMVVMMKDVAMMEKMMMVVMTMMTLKTKKMTMLMMSRCHDLSGYFI
jgi:hypothetical protein